MLVYSRLCDPIASVLRQTAYFNAIDEGNVGIFGYKYGYKYGGTTIDAKQSTKPASNAHLFTATLPPLSMMVFKQLL